MPYENLLYDKDGSLATITINRPDKRNAVSIATLAELHEAVGVAVEDPEVRVVVLTGAGEKAFIAGADLNEVADRDRLKALEPGIQGFSDGLTRLPKIFIAAINGFCMGGGLEIALGCDIRIASTNARFGTPEGNIGIIPGGGATQRLPRLVGRGWALEMLIMGNPIDAEQALRIGLITRLVAPGELLPTTRQMAEHIAAKAPLVPRFMKAMVHHGMEGSMAAGLALEKFAQAALIETEDKQEGIRAFLEKRPPEWKGK